MSVKNPAQFTGNFTRVDNALINDKRLGPYARMIGVWLASKPSHWTFTTESVGHEFGPGRDATRKALSQLRAAGYLTTERYQDEGGHFSSVNIFTHRPGTDSPKTDFQALVNRRPVDQGLVDGTPVNAALVNRRPVDPVVLVSTYRETTELVTTEEATTDSLITDEAKTDSVTGEPLSTDSSKTQEVITDLATTETSSEINKKTSTPGPEVVSINPPMANMLARIRASREADEASKAETMKRASVVVPEAQKLATPQVRRMSPREEQEAKALAQLRENYPTQNTRTIPNPRARRREAAA